jgi:hypothetical protein
MPQYEPPEDREDESAPDTSSGRHSRARIVQPRITLSRLARRLFGSPLRRIDLARRTLAPLLLAAIPLYWVLDATYRATLTTLGRDQGIFQYIAWAVRSGDIDYRDVRDVNGPLVHMVHMLFLALGGADEHRFHVVDMLVTGASFALVGALLPDVWSSRTPRKLERVSWAIAGWVTLSSQHALYTYWNQAQRESFANWFLLPSLALQATLSGTRATRAKVRTIAALSTLAFFAKSSFSLFVAMQLGLLLLPPTRSLGLRRRTRLWAFLSGAMLGAIPPLLYLLRFGDLLAFVRITARDVPSVYRFIWARSPYEILGDEGPLRAAVMGLAAAALVLALIAIRELPSRARVLALAPVTAIGAVIAQAKGFGYHFHPLTATTHMAFLCVVGSFWFRHRNAPKTKSAGKLAAVAAAVAYATFLASSMHASPHTKNVWILAGGETPTDRLQREYFDSFKTNDFFPWELRQGARYVDENTSPNARVQVYGMDPYFLFLAQRRSATPYIYAYDLNADAALDGGWSNRPTDREMGRIKAWRSAHEEDLRARLEASPPEAFVFLDRAPLITWQDAWEDFRHCCKDTARWVALHYHPARSFGEVHVWLRDDLPVRDREDVP